MSCTSGDVLGAFFEFEEPSAVLVERPEWERIAIVAAPTLLLLFFSLVQYSCLRRRRQVPCGSVLRISAGLISPTAGVVVYTLVNILDCVNIPYIDILWYVLLIAVPLLLLIPTVMLRHKRYRAAVAVCILLSGGIVACDAMFVRSTDVFPEITSTDTFIVSQLVFILQIFTVCIGFICLLLDYNFTYDGSGFIKNPNVNIPEIRYSDFDPTTRHSSDVA
jgi:hypothetical protein